MMKPLRTTLVSAAMLALAVPAPLLAQSPAGALLTFIIPAGKFGSNNYTNTMVSSFAAAKKFCGALDKAYQVDCLAERIGEIAKDIPADSDYAEVRSILTKTSEDMAALARANRDSALPRAKATSGATQTSRPLTPVSQASADATNAQAAAILDATTTLLLRSPDDESGKKLHYARIAEALGSNKTLLRSA
ncbi:hypothetical protein [Seohaeicola zhoushanensis]|uniref:Uncharacterized protein n=1 Tax=Seohaeicola zhoushanensis TaxID=1569283 RepID=A0A8J3M9P2_9RHOB|nr:hypothetical protein [Seohaeicola zhoushanensis]GHF67673.1 hypothetical protein GCM10017056_43550 [Seohaeicola zhoushanensis]